MSNNNNPDREAEEAGPVPVPVPPDNEPEAPGGVAPPPRPVVAAAAAAVVEDNDDDKIRTNTVPPEVIKLWKEVGKGLEFNQTVVWQNSVKSLDAARQYLPVSKECRNFVDKYVLQIINIMLDQQPTIGELERSCVEKTLSFGVGLVAVDLEIHNQRFAQGDMADCETLLLLQPILDKSKNYYRGQRNHQWRHHNVHNLGGRPEVRISLTDTFRLEGGFARLSRYMMDRVNLPKRSNATMGPVLTAAADGAADTTLAAMDATPVAEEEENGDDDNNSSPTTRTESSATKPTTKAAAATQPAKPQFLSWDLLRQIFLALNEAIPTVQVLLAAFYPSSPQGGSNNNNNTNDRLQLNGEKYKGMSEAAIQISRAYMEFIRHCSEDELKKIPPEHLSKNQKDMQRIFDKLIVVRRDATYEFFAFWRELILTFIQSQSLPLRLLGWSQVDGILAASDAHRPPPRSYRATGAGISFVNGEYYYNGLLTPDGYAYTKPGGSEKAGAMDVSYQRQVPNDEEGGGKKLTLFRCSMRSQQKWWFLSEADDEQPGTDRDVDYYQHKSKSHEERQPPASGWNKCNKAGEDPPPEFEPVGLMVADGQDLNTLEHQLAKWAIENHIIELVLGDSVHREIVSRSTKLLKFLASMCERDGPPKATNGIISSNEYCLQTSHLLLAWKTCTRKTDAAVSAQIYQLLVSILPSCPSSLAIPLLKAIQDSLVQSKANNNGGGKSEKQDYLNEVADFCTALAVTSISDSNDQKGAATGLRDDVRAEVLGLFWSVFTHPDASSLKSYDVLKQYVTHELQVEPLGEKLREKYLLSCIDSLRRNSKQLVGGTVDEVQALRMVKLTSFVLQACPQDQAAKLVMHDQGALPLLLSEELTAYLKRRESGARSQTSIRKSPSLDFDAKGGANDLAQRLGILRNVYGMNDEIFMSTLQLNSLWQQCRVPADREEVMVFVDESSATNPRPKADQTAGLVDGAIGPAKPPDSASPSAFTLEVSENAFLTLFCSPNLSFQLLGEKAYKSFNSMFSKLRKSETRGRQVTRAALDALWRVCLEARNDAVATQAMRDLLTIYAALDLSTATPIVPDPMQTEPVESVNNSEESFGKRVFDCLSGVKMKLDAKDPSAELAADRCLRILNAAIGQAGANGSITASTMNRLARLTPDNTLKNNIMKYIPHGMHGQACYRQITITAKRQIMQGHQGHGQHSFHERDQGNSNQTRNGSSPTRFQLDVHPFETLYSIKTKVATKCQCPITSVKAVNLIGRGSVTMARTGDAPQNFSIGTLPEDSVVDEVGVVQGSEIIYVIADRQSGQQNINPSSARTVRNGRSRDLSDMFFDDSVFLDKLFQLLLAVLESLPWREPDEMTDISAPACDGHKLVWDLLLAMPTNNAVETQVMFAAKSNAAMKILCDEDAMEVDSRNAEQWSKLLDLRNFHRSVYVLLAIDAFLQPAVEVLSSLPSEQRAALTQETKEDAAQFRKGFIESGGFDAVVAFFSSSENCPEMSQSMTRMGNAVALRILKRCVFGDGLSLQEGSDGRSNGPDAIGSKLLESLTDTRGLLRSVTSMVVADSRVSTSTIADALQFLHLLFRSLEACRFFASLPDNTAEKFLVTLLLWEGTTDPVRPAAGLQSATKVRTTTKDLVVMTPVLADHALSWLKNAIDSIQVTSESTAEYFDLLGSLISDSAKKTAPEKELMPLATAVCRKLASCQRPSSEAQLMGDSTTSVLCGCLYLLRNLIATAGGDILREGTTLLVAEYKVTPWSSEFGPSMVKPQPDDVVLVDLMGVLFDAFLSPGGATSVVAICSDPDSKARGFEAISVALRTIKDGHGFIAVVARVNGLMASASPFLRHRWGQSVGGNEGSTRHGKKSSQYSGLHNQGCTCYMNSVLQQLFMMPELRKSMCSAPLPRVLRSSGGIVSSRGDELIGKEVKMHWENGSAYHAKVEGFNEKTGMHTIRYGPVPVAPVGQANHQQIRPEDVEKANLPPFLPDEFILSEGRPGKETGVFDVVDDDGGSNENDQVGGNEQEKGTGQIEETEDEAASRHLMEEVQRTFIHLEEGSRGRWFDPRALVEACACLKLEFDVWQQNDASEFATKLLDRLETSLKRWAPEHFRYLDHTFGLKQTKQKICKECGLKSNREEKLLNVDCQIRGKADIHEALATMCETEIMEGNNQVFCEKCKKNTDTVLRTAISELPNMLILSLKRFDLDYTSFETVKLNSRCAFGQSLNMKRYTLEGVEAMEQTAQEEQESDAMDTGNEEAALSHLPDEDYEYKLAGVLVHSGVAQGGHYYSFIKDRNPGTEEKWYRFDDEDVTAFDPGSIETECFGGKVKKETKWPNGQFQTVESEQFANALMLFYEKVKVTEQPPPPQRSAEEVENGTAKLDLKTIEMMSGYDVFEPDVSRSNATHRWQSFLFDYHFQEFLLGLLGICHISSPGFGHSADSSGSEFSKTAAMEGPWRTDVLKMLVTFLFDIYLYGSDRKASVRWLDMLEDIIESDPEFARGLVHTLAQKSQLVSDNWFRTYLLDSPETSARILGIRIFARAFRSAVTLSDEQSKLEAWSQAWKRQLSSIGTDGALPTGLQGEWSSYEDLDSPAASNIGILLSHLNELIDASTRCWKFHLDVSRFIHRLADRRTERKGGAILRQAIIECLIPARLLCLVVRNGSMPDELRAAFPGAAVSFEVGETQIKPEQHPQPMITTIGGNQNFHANDYRGGRQYSDYKYIIQSLGLLMGIPGLHEAALVNDQRDESRGRQRIFLTEQASSALREVFTDYCTEGAPGMAQDEIEAYLQKCRVDIPAQRILDIMAKYPTPAGDGRRGGGGSNYLSLDGFLAYYRDIATTEDFRIRCELHDFGFRPDLTRRSRNARIKIYDGRETEVAPAESVAIDVYESLSSNDAPRLGKLADRLMQCFRLHQVAWNWNEHISQYVLAAANLGRSSDHLIVESLDCFIRAHPFHNNDFVGAAFDMLKVLSSIPDEYQDRRIRAIMLCDVRGREDIPLGLIVAARHFHEAVRRNMYHHNDSIHQYYERYVSTVKDLLSIQAILSWMNDNRPLWNFMERDLMAPMHHQGMVQSRGDYSGRRDADDGIGMPMDHNQHSDSDNMAGIGESEEDDDDSRFNDEIMFHHTDAPPICNVSGAGNPVVDGIYVRDGEFDGVMKYSKRGRHNGVEATYSIFRCHVSNNTKHWYISVVPNMGLPGTSSDIDFYSAPAGVEGRLELEIPPRLGWTKSNEGRDPAPKIDYKEEANDVEPDPIPVFESTGEA